MGNRDNRNVSAWSAVIVVILGVCCLMCLLGVGAFGFMAFSVQRSPPPISGIKNIQLDAVSGPSEAPNSDVQKWEEPPSPE